MNTSYLKFPIEFRLKFWQRVRLLLGKRLKFEMTVTIRPTADSVDIDYVKTTWGEVD